MWNKGGVGSGLGVCIQNQSCDIRNHLDCGESGVCDTGGAYVYHGLVEQIQLSSVSKDIYHTFSK